MAIHILRLPELKLRIGVKRSSIYGKLDPKCKQFDPSFPKPVRLGGRSIGWVDFEISQWLEARVAERDAKATAPQHNSAALGKVRRKVAA